MPSKECYHCKLLYIKCTSDEYTWRLCTQNNVFRVYTLPSLSAVSFIDSILHSMSFFHSIWFFHSSYIDSFTQFILISSFTLNCLHLLNSLIKFILFSILCSSSLCSLNFSSSFNLYLYPRFIQFQSFLYNNYFILFI